MLFLVTIKEPNCTTELIVKSNSPINARFQAVKQLKGHLSENYTTRCGYISPWQAKQWINENS